MECSCKDKLLLSKLTSVIEYVLTTSCEISLNGIPPKWWLVSIGSGNGLVSSGNKSLPEPMWTRSMLPYSVTRPKRVNSWRPIQNGQYFTDDIFKCIFFNENIWISNKIALKLVPKGPINNISALVQMMAWWRPGNKPLSEPMMVSLLTHICDNWPQRVNREM